MLRVPPYKFNAWRPRVENLGLTVLIRHIVGVAKSRVTDCKKYS